MASLAVRSGRTEEERFQPQGELSALLRRRTIRYWTVRASQVYYVAPRVTITYVLRVYAQSHLAQLFPSDIREILVLRSFIVKCSQAWGKRRGSYSQGRDLEIRVYVWDPTKSEGQNPTRRVPSLGKALLREEQRKWKHPDSLEKRSPWLRQHLTSSIIYHLSSFCYF